MIVWKLLISFHTESYKWIHCSYAKNSTLQVFLNVPSGHLYMYLKLDIILVKKNHVIRVIFQDQAMYACTLYRGAKTCTVWKKGVFLVTLINFGKDRMDKLRKTHAKRVFSLFSYLKNMCTSGCVLKVLLQGWYPAWNTCAPPPAFNNG